MTARTNGSPVGVKAIDHVTIVVKDLEKSTRFYTEVLGMRQVDRPAFGFPGAWFQAGTTKVHMNVESEEAGQAGIRFHGGTRLSRGFHYAFEVASCDEAAERLEQLGVPVLEGPRARPDGARQLYIHDPDGHLVELFSMPRILST